MLDRMLVPLDGSHLAEAAVPLALSLAEKRRAKVRLLHVRELPAFAAGQNVLKPAAAEVYLRAVAGRAGAGSSLEYEVRDAPRPEGVPDGIDAAVRGWEADLVVMATHGRGGASRFWMGSVADRYLRSASVPVLLVRPAEHAGDRYEPTPPKRVIIPLDGSELADEALPWGEALAGALNTPVLLLEVITYPGAPSLESPEQGSAVTAAEGEARARLRVLAQASRARGVDASERVVRAPAAAPEILREADADPIVMTTRGRSGLARAMLGSVADKVVRGALGPVLVVPRGVVEG
jgi:nucleotide-binding universal stress UspA family protein